METFHSFAIVPAIGFWGEVILAGFAGIVFSVVAVAAALAILLRGYLKIILDLFLNRSQIPGSPDPEVRIAGEPVNLETDDGVKLRGVFFPGTGAEGRTVIFCHEYGSDMNSVAPYERFLRPAGLNVFAFDFRGHGQSGNANGYSPKQWLTQYEVADLEAAIRHVRGRADAEGGRIGLLGLSRGACSCICAASGGSHVKAVVAEGAFATAGLLIEGIKRWISVYAVLPFIHPWLPEPFFRWLSRISMRRAERMLKCRFVAVEDHLRRLSPTPLLMIQGGRDSYVTVEHARRLFEQAQDPKEFWVVAGARHNEGARVAAAEYERRVVEFFRKHLN